MYPKELFSLLADDTRFRLLMLLQEEGELCVCELEVALAKIQPKISRHLAILRNAGIVMTRRDANRVFYRLLSPMPEWIKHIMETASARVLEDATLVEEMHRLQVMPNRPQCSEAASTGQTHGSTDRFCSAVKKSA